MIDGVTKICCLYFIKFYYVSKISVRFVLKPLNAVKFQKHVSTLEKSLVKKSNFYQFIFFLYQFSFFPKGRFLN